MSHPSEPSINDLEQAGRRAAMQPVPAAPALGDLRRKAGRMALVRRTVGGGVAAVLAVGAGMGLAFATADRPATEISVAAAPQQIAAPDDTDGADTAPPQDESVPPVILDEAPAGEVTGDEDPADEAPAVEPGEEDAASDDLRFEFAPAGFDMGIRVLSGSGALDAAATAADTADEVRTYDDTTIWVDHRDDGQSTASALFDDDKFVEVTAPTDRLDDYLALLDGEKLPFGSDFGPWSLGETHSVPEGLVPGTDAFAEWLAELQEEFQKGLPDGLGEYPFAIDEMLEFGDRSGDTGPLEFFFGFDAELDPYDFEWYHDEYGGQGFGAEQLKKFEAFLEGDLPEDSAFDWFFGDNGMRFIHPDGASGAGADCLFIEDADGSFSLEIPEGCAPDDVVPQQGESAGS